MRLLILGVTGDIGRAYRDEALRRGHRVTGCARRPDSTLAQHGLFTMERLDVLADASKLAMLMSQHDVTLSALRPADGQEPLLVNMTASALEAARSTGQPIYVTGGASPLRIAEDSELTVLTAPSFLPDAVKPIATACAKQDALLGDFPDVAWTCLRPPAQLLQGQRTGRYALGRDVLVFNAERRSEISFADFAVAMLDLIELKPAIHQRLTVGW